jgi:hypothetical protein
MPTLDPPNFLSNGCRKQSGSCMNLASHFCPMPRLGMHLVIYLHFPTRLHALCLIEHRDNFIFLLFHLNISYLNSISVIQFKSIVISEVSSKVVCSFFFFVSWGRVRLSPPPDDRWWMWSSKWNETWQGKWKYSKKTCPSVSLSTTNFIWSDVDSHPGRCGGKPATNRVAWAMARPYIDSCMREEFCIFLKWKIYT